MKIKLTKKEFENLSKESQELALDLGVYSFPKKRVVKEPPFRVPLKEYVLRVNYTCKLCGTVHSQTFLMEDKDGELLKGREISSVKADKVTPQTVARCKYCATQLILLRKEELVKKLITLAGGV